MSNITIGDFELELYLAETQFKDLLQDFNFVKGLNTSMANRYAEVMGVFPTVEELDIVIDELNDYSIGVTGSYDFEYPKEKTQERLVKLRKFRSALVALEKNDPQIKPKRYEDVIED